MEVSLAKRLILSVSMHGGRYFFIQPKILCPSKKKRTSALTLFLPQHQGRSSFCKLLSGLRMPVYIFRLIFGVHDRLVFIQSVISRHRIADRRSQQII